MAKYDGMKVTAAGRTLLAKAIAGTELRFTRVMAGDGALPPDTNIYELTGLIHPVKEIPISSIRVTTVGQATITAMLSNEGQTQLLTVREIGIFAENPDGGNEILYAYTNAGEYPDFIPGQDGADVHQSLLSFVTVIDNAQNVTAVIDGSLVYVTQEDLNHQVSQLESKIDGLFKSPAPAADFWTRQNGDGNVLRPAPLSAVKQAILGVTDIDALRRAVEVNQDNLAGILLALEAQSIYPGYDHMIVEDFKAPDMIDTLTRVVVSVVAGDDSIDLDTLNGVIPGSVYTITDGIASESVQVKSMSTENGIQRIILTEPVVNTYRLAGCRLYRTSASVEEGAAKGPAVTASKTWSPPGVWQGQGANVEYDVPLTVSVGNMGEYDIEGDIGITADGLLTLEVS